MAVSARIAAQRPDQRRALPFDRAARPAKQDRKGRGVPEVFFGESLAAGGGGARHDQRGRLEPAFDAEPGDAEGTAADQDDDEADDGRAKPRLTWAPPHGDPCLRRLHRRRSGAAAHN